MTREEVKKIRYEKKVKKALKCLRFRNLKNFLFWLTGVIVMPVVLVLSMFIGLKVVPIKSYTGGLEQEYVSEELANQSILDVILNLNKYGVSDIPGVKDLVLEAINGSGIDEFITINEEKLDAVRFSYDKESGKEILTEVLDCISINPSVIGDASTISMLNEYEEVPEDKVPQVIDGRLADENANPKLYYYQVTQTGGGNAHLSAGGDENVQSYKYARAFNDDGTAVKGVTYQTKLYYPAIKDVPIMDLTGMIDEMVARIDFGEVLSVVLEKIMSGNAQFQPIELFTVLVDTLSGKSINDIESIPIDLLKNIRISHILGEKRSEILLGFDTLGIFNWGNEVNQDNEFGEKLKENNKVIAKDEKGNLLLNPALYYYFNEEDYVRVFDDNGVKYDASPALFEGTSIYYANLLDISISELLKVAGDLFGKLQLREILGVLDLEGDLFDALFKDDDTIEDFYSNEFVGELFNRLSLNSLQANLGAVNDLEIFTKWQHVETDKPLSQGQTQIDTDKYNAKLYYYVANPLDKTDDVLNDTAYARAFNDDGTAVEGVTYQTELYYAKLSYIGFIDMAELLPIRLGNLSAIELLNKFGGANIGPDDLLARVLGDKTINQLGNLDDTCLYWVLPYDANNEICKLILQSFYTLSGDVNIDRKNYENITISMLSSNKLNLNNINLSTLITDSDTLDMICYAINSYRLSEEYKTTHNGATGAQISSDKITVGDISDFKPDYIALSSVASGISDANIKNIICQLVGQEIGSEDFSKVLVKDLSKANSNKISLGLFIKDSTTLDMICNAINQYRESDEYKLAHGSEAGTQISSDKITVGDIAHFNPDYIALSAVANGMSPEMKTLIGELVGNSFENLLVKDLSKAQVENIKLNTVLPYYDDNNPSKIIDNTALYKILLEASGTSLEGLNNKEIEELALALKVNALSNFDIKKITLGTAMPGANSTLKTLIEQITNSQNSFNSITIADLSGEITVDNITLSTVLGEYGAEGKNNETLYKILLEASGETGITDSNISGKANTLNMSVFSNFELSNVSLKTALSGSSSASNNVILNALMEKGVKLDEVGTAINNLTLYEVFGTTCFTTDESQKVEDEYSNCMFELVKDRPVYDENGVAVKDEQDNIKTCDAYVHIDTDRANELRSLGEKVYYLHKNDGIWLLMCFESGPIDKDITHVDYGRPNEYYISDNTLGSLLNSNQGENNFMSVALTKATLRQLMDAGMLNVTNEEYYAATIEDIVNIVNGLNSGNK